MMRIAVAGSGRLAATLLNALWESSHTVVAVVQNGRKNIGVMRRLVPAYLSVMGGDRSATGFAVRHGLPIVWLDQMADELEPLRALEPDVLLVGGFDIILKGPVLDLPRLGCVNTHSSLLPKHRGPNPFSWALLADAQETGVTFHAMDEGIDTGDILDQTAFDIEPRDTALTLYVNACEVAGERIVEVIDRVEAEGVRGRPQDHEAATYDKKLNEADTFIDWTLTAEEIDRRVRAFSPMPMARFRFGNHTIRAGRVEYEAAPVEAEPGTVLSPGSPVRIATGGGTLVIHTAYCAAPFPWYWPAFWSRPKQGERVG